MTFNLSLENKAAVVTGGSRGIGRAIALEFAERGAAVVVNYNKSPEAAEEVVKKIQEKGGKAAVKHMMRKRVGRIINMASVAGQLGNPGQTNYSASKGGQIAFTKALAREVAARNITVNAIAPGFIDTEILDAMAPEMLEAALKLVPLARKGTVDEVAYAASFLASDGAAFITGQVLGVDGGMAMM